MQLSLGIELSDNTSLYLNDVDSWFSLWESQSEKPWVVLDTETMNVAMFEIIERYRLSPNEDLDPDYIWAKHAAHLFEEHFWRSLAATQKIDMPLFSKTTKGNVTWGKTIYKSAIKDAKARTHHLANALPTSYGQVTCVQMGFSLNGAHHVLVVQVPAKGDERWESVVGLLEKMNALKTTWVIHNAEFDYGHIYKTFKVKLTGTIHDTKHWMGLYLGGETLMSSKLKDMCATFNVPETMAKKDENPLLTDWRYTTDPNRLAYAISDITSLLDIYPKLWKLMGLRGLHTVAKLEGAILNKLLDTGVTGVRMDTELLRQEADELRTLLEVTLSELALPFDLGQSIKLLGFVSDKFKTNLTTLDKKQCGMMEEVRNNEALWNYLEKIWLAKSTKKQLTDVVSRLQNNRVYTTYVPVPTTATDASEKSGGAVTGRMTTKGHATQTVPKDKRKAYIADEGKVFICTDYNAIEFWVAAHLSQDPAMLKMNKEKIDPHTFMASKLFDIPMEQVGKKSKERQIGKGANFQFIFGQWHTTFAKMMASPNFGGLQISDAEAELFRRKFFQTYSVYERYMETNRIQGVVNGYVTTALGRRRYWNESEFMKKREAFRAKGYTVYDLPVSVTVGGCCISDPNVIKREKDLSWRNICYNTPVQGTAADIYKLAVALMPPWVRQVIHVHDQFVGEVPLELAEEGKIAVEEAMIKAAKKLLPSIDVAVETDISKFWI